MRRDSRLSVALHVLLHMSETGGAITSETLGPLMKTHPVVLRRTMAGLRKAGIVRSEKGHGGGWSLARTLDSVTLEDVYDALGVSAPFNIAHRDQSPKCLLERAVNRAVGSALAEAEALLVERFRSITVAGVLANADTRRRAQDPVKAREVILSAAKAGQDTAKRREFMVSVTTAGRRR